MGVLFSGDTFNITGGLAYAPAQTNVPEPTTLGLLVFGVIAAAGRRLRNVS